MLNISSESVLDPTLHLYQRFSSTPSLVLLKFHCSNNVYEYTILASTYVRDIFSIGLTWHESDLSIFMQVSGFLPFLYLNVFYFLYTPHSLHLPMGVKLAPYCFVCMNNAKMKKRELIFLQHIASTSLAIYIKMRLRDHMEVLSIIFYELL